MKNPYISPEPRNYVADYLPRLEQRQTMTFATTPLLVENGAFAPDYTDQLLREAAKACWATYGIRMAMVKVTVEITPYCTPLSLNPPAKDGAQ